MREELFQHYISRITDEDSFFALLEARDDILPMLEAQYQKEASQKLRTIIVRIIWEHRNKNSLVFLAHALSDPSDMVWQEALNGIVTIGGEHAKEQLRIALRTANSNKANWIVEALDQMKDK